MKMLALAAAFALCAAAPPEAKSGNVVKVDLRSFGYNPSPISLRAGAEVTMVFTNTAGVSHEFKAPDFFHLAKIESGKVDKEGSVELKPHTSESVTLIPARGTFEVHCGHFMHEQMGMKTTIYVQ